jgi:hypothetical protein
MTKEEKVDYLKKNENQFKHKFSQKNVDLMDKINEYRLKNGSQSCYYEDNEKLPYYILHGLSEEILFDYKNIFALPNRQYLLKFKNNSFEELLNNNSIDKEIMLNEDVNKLSITDIGDYKYILLSDDIDALFAPIDFEDIKKKAVELKQKELFDFSVENFLHEE